MPSMCLLSYVLSGVYAIYVFVIILCVGVGHMPFLCVCYHPVCWSGVYAISLCLSSCVLKLSICCLYVCHCPVCWSGVYTVSVFVILCVGVVVSPSPLLYFPLSLTLYTLPDTLSKSSWMKTCPNQKLRTYSPLCFLQYQLHRLNLLFRMWIFLCGLLRDLEGCLRKRCKCVVFQLCCLTRVSFLGVSLHCFSLLLLTFLEPHGSSHLGFSLGISMSRWINTETYR